MTPTQIAATLAFVAGTAAGMSSSALLREVPGAKSYFVHHLDVDQMRQPDGTTAIVTTACSDATLVLQDGKKSNVDLGCVRCPVGKGDVDVLKSILANAVTCAQNAP